MKAIGAELGFFLRGSARRSLKLLLAYLAFLVVLVLVFSWLFVILSRRLEGEEHTYISGLYWTITVMTTLGLGDVTFHTDPGRIFSGLVTLSGFFFLLVLLPFGMISLFLAPWLEERLRYRPAEQLPDDTRDHVLISGWDPVARALAARLAAKDIDCAMLEKDGERAQRLEAMGLRVVYGIPTDDSTLSSARLQTARALIANMSDTDNANLVLSARAVAETPVIAVADSSEGGEILELAGAQLVVSVKDVLGRYIGVRTTVRGAHAHVVDTYDDLLFAEMPILGTRLAGKTLAESRLRERTGVSVVGLWRRGRFSPATADALLGDDSVIMFTGTADQLETLEATTGTGQVADHVIILGYGTVGQSVAAFLSENGVAHRVVDRFPTEVPEAVDFIEGDASRRGVLLRAGITEATGVAVTTNDDGTNIFLTLATRHLAPHVRIVARANREENVSQLYAAGADFVVSVTSVGASIIMNALEGKETVFLTEGVHVFWREVGPRLVGKDLAEAGVTAATEAIIVGVRSGDCGEMRPPARDLVLGPGMTLLLVGSPKAETSFDENFHA